MGGVGSGRERGFSGKMLVEDCLILNSSWLLQNNYFDVEVGQTAYRSISWTGRYRQDEFGSVLTIWRASYDEMWVELSATHQRIVLRAVPQRFGGQRWYFACPKCAKRCAKLYLPAGAFFCRACHGLTYESCNTRIMSSISALFGCMPKQIRAAFKQQNWWRWPGPWRRKRDRRPGYRDRLASKREILRESDRKLGR
jgi:hypothetical protein